MVKDTGQINPDPVVIVTGASRGLGAAVAVSLNRLGVSLTLIARSRETLERTASSVDANRGRVLAISGDVADSSFCEDAVKKTLSRYGRIDALINNAGVVAPLQPVEKSDVDVWKYCIEVNLLGAYYMIRFALPALNRVGGRVVNVSSGAAKRSIFAASAYCTAKAGLTHFTSVLAEENPRITAVSVRPGVVDTAMQETLRREGPAVMPPDQADFYLALKKKGELEPPEVPGRAIAWLALHAPPSWSGRFMNYDDPEIVSGVRRLFGG